MSRKRATNSGWESDEENLLNDGGVGVIKAEDDEIDEEALLGLGDDDGTDYLLEDDTGGDFQGGFEQTQDEMLEIAVDEAEISELAVDEEDNYGNNMSAGLEEEEQLDYNDDLPQTDESEVHVEYGHVEEQSVDETDRPQDESQQVYTNTESSFDELQSRTADTTQDSESESEDSNSEEQGRGRFKSERSGKISISKVKSRTDIPDTLEVSAEQEAQLNQFSDNRQGRGRNNRGQGRDQQRGGHQGNRPDNRSGGGPIRVHQGRPHQQAGFFRPGQMRPPQPFGLPGGPRNLMPQSRARAPSHHLVPVQAGMSPMRSQPLLNMVRSQGNRMFLPGQDGGFNMARPQQMGISPLLPGQLRPGVPNSMAGLPGQAGRPILQQPQPQPQPLFRPVVPASAAPARPHTIHINPNFRGNTPRDPQVSAIPSLGQAQSNFSPSVLSPAIRLPPGAADGERRMLLQDAARPHLPGQPQSFGQPQGFQQGPRMGLNMRPGQQQQPRFTSPNQGVDQGVMATSGGHPPSSPAGFPGQRGPALQPQNPRQFGGYNNQPTSSLPVHAQNTSTSPRFSSPQPGLFHSPPQQGQHPGLRSHAQQRMGMQQRGVNPQNRNAVTTAKKLSQQARNTQKAKVMTQAVNKNITVVPLKRHSTDNDSSISPKVAKTTGESVAEEPGDAELKRGLEEQKKLREMIRKRKEEARRRQAAARRQELESRLKEKGLSIEDVEGGSGEAGNKTASGKTSPQTQGAQQIKTVVTQGGKKQLVSRSKRQQIKQQQQQPAQSQQQGFQKQPFNQQHQEQFHGQQAQQSPQMFGSHQVQQQQQQFDHSTVNSAGLTAQQQPFQPAAHSLQANRPRQPVQNSPQTPFRQQAVQQSRVPTPQQFQSQKGLRQSVPRNQFSPNQPPQQGLPQASGDAFNVRQVQQTNNSFVGRGVQQGVARGQMASVSGRGQMMRGGGAGQMTAGRGRGAPFTPSPQPAAAHSSIPQPSSNRTVLPVGRGRVVTRGGAGAASAPGRTVMERQVLAHSAPPAIKGLAPGIGCVQKVAIDNLARGTAEMEIRRGCEAIGPVLDVVMIESQRKAIVTFGNKMHAVLFAKQWNRRMVNMSVLSVTLLP